ncbi:MAG: histidinol-phosphatase [Eubacteriales bacterium]|nr:histidinol-phosphatase [Eubacteriales bacterium]
MELYQKINLHSHTFRCHHATGRVEEYAEEAMRQNLKVLGVSDHTPFPEKRDEGVRMLFEELPEYLREIETAEKKYPEIRFFKALECDYEREMMPFYQELKKNYPLDYLIGSVHYFYENGRVVDAFHEPIDHARLRLYTEAMLENIDSELFAFAAHPDLFALQLEQWDAYAEDCVREICRLAEMKKKPLEINVNGRHKQGQPYPDSRFWKIVGEYDIETLINSDAHTVENLCAEKEYGYELQQRYHLKTWHRLKELV